MADHDRRLVGPVVEGLGQPGELLRSDLARHAAGLIEGVDQEQVGPRHRDDLGEFSSHDLRSLTLPARLHRPDEVVAVVVVAEGQMQWQAGLPQRAEQIDDGGVIADLAGLLGQIADDQPRGRPIFPRRDFLGDGRQMVGHVHVLEHDGPIRGDVGIGEQGERMRIGFGGIGEPGA